MSIHTSCPHCGAAGTLPPSAAGRRVRCPGCRQLFVAAATPAGDQFDFDITAERTEPNPNPGRRYQPKKSGWGVIALTGILGVVGLAGLAVVLHATGVVSLLPARDTAVTQATQSSPVAAAPTKPVARVSIPNAGEGHAGGPPASAPTPQKPWIGPPPNRAKPLATITPSEPVEGIASLHGTAETIGEMKFVSVTGLGNAVPQICWTTDADAFYHLDAAGTLRLIAYPTLREFKVLPLGQKCSRMALGEAGLIVTLPQIEEVWVFDPNSFALRSRVGLAGVQEVVASPRVKEAIGFCREGNPVIIEFAGEGGTVSEVSQERQALSTLPPDIGGFGQPALTPDGKHLFALGYGEQLLRYRVEGRVLFLEETSARIASGTKKPICISADGKFVAAPCPAGNLKAGDHATFVFSVNDLSKPAFTIASGQYPQTIGFDVAAGRIYTQNAANALVMFDLAGAKLREYSIGGAQAALLVQQILVHPSGKRKLLLTGAGLFSVAPIEEPR